jgi:hypothetical protein
MKSWLRWLNGGSYSSSKNPVALFGRFILSLWVAIIAVTGIIMGIIFLSDPTGFSPPKYKPVCGTIEIDGQRIDICDDILP